MVINNGKIKQTLRKEINEIGNFILFLRKNNKRVHSFNCVNDEWSFKSEKPFDLNKMNEKWMKSERYEYLAGL
jgi:hypothetical protein